MIKILKLDRTLIFLILICPWCVKFFFKDTIDLEIIDKIGKVIWFTWIGFLSIELKKRLPKNIEISGTLFTINFLFLFIYLTILSLFDISIDPFVDNGLLSMFWRFSLVIYFLFAVVQILDYLSKLLTCSEEEKIFPFRKRIGDMIMIIFFPIGIWWLQPRIKKILDKPEVITERYISVREREKLDENVKD